MKVTGVIILGVFLWSGPSPVNAQEAARVLECGDIFNTETSSRTLSQHFGEGVAVSTKVYVGEGFYEDGMVIFADSPADKLEVLWKSYGPPSIQRVCIRDVNSTWHTPQGIRIGSSLKSVERMNGRPFELVGFAWDGGGGTRSWSGGNLDQSSGTACGLSLRFEPGLDHLTKPYFDKVLGDRKFSSANPVMQKIDPHVSRLCLIFK